MRGFASRIVPQLWARVLERLLLLEFGQEVGRNEPTRSPPADTARAALAKTSADSIDERPMESLSIFCKRIHEGTIRSSLPLTFSGASRRGRPRDPRNGQLPGVQRLRVPCASVDLSELPGEGSRLDPDFWSTGVLRGMDPELLKRRPGPGGSRGRTAQETQGCSRGPYLLRVRQPSLTAALLLRRRMNWRRFRAAARNLSRWLSIRTGPPAPPRPSWSSGTGPRSAPCRPGMSCERVRARSDMPRTLTVCRRMRARQLWRCMQLRRPHPKWP